MSWGRQPNTGVPSLCLHLYRIQDAIDAVLFRCHGLTEKDGPVKVIVTPQSEEAGRGKSNRPALEALSSLLAQPDDLTPGQWAEIEKVIEKHPLRIRRASAA